MPVTEPQPLMKRRPQQHRTRQRSGAPVQPWDSSAFAPPSKRRYSPLALGLTLFVHLLPLLLLLAVPGFILTEEEKKPQKQTKVELVPPPFVQVNPFANQDRIRTDQEGAQNQRAAQEAESMPNSHAEGPQLEGEAPEFNRIISGNPEAPDVAPSPVSTQGDSDSLRPPSGGAPAAAPASNAFQLQTRSEYQQAVAQQRPQPAAPQQSQQPTATPSASTQQTQATAESRTTLAQPVQPTAQAQPAQAQPQPSTSSATARPATQPQQIEQYGERTVNAGRESAAPEPSTATLAAKPDAPLTEEGLPPAEQTQTGQQAAAAQEPATHTASPNPQENVTQPTPAQELPAIQPQENVATQPLPVEPLPTEPQPAPTQPEPEPMPDATPVAEQAPAAGAIPQEPAPEQQPALAQGADETPAIDPNAPRPRPTLEPRISAGPLRHQSVTANARGLVAIDSRFSEFGAYQQRMIEAISAQWYLLARQSKAIDSEYGTQVVLVFTMNDQGIISNTSVRFTNASAAATLLCINAVESRSPFGLWTADMKRVLGERQSVTFTFYYR